MWSLSKSCKAVDQVVASPQASCTRTLFKRSYDLPGGKARKAILEELRNRELVGWGNVVFSFGMDYREPHLQPSHQEVAHLKLARKLIIGKCSHLWFDLWLPVFRR